MSIVPAVDVHEMRWHPVDARDLGIATLIFCLGVWLGTWAVIGHRAAGGPQYFYQSEFGPAVMLACGHGFQNPDSESVPVLLAFLSERSDALDCAELPRTMRVSALNPFQRVSRYLELAVGITWRLGGVSWSRLAILSGVLFGSVAALNYALFRLGMSRVFSLICMVPVLLSTANFMLVPHIRDYAKGPFLLSMFVIMGFLVARPVERREIALSGLAGVVAGLGLGFRTDLFIAVPPFLVTLAFLVPRSVTIRTRLAAILVFLTAFGVVAFPVLRDYSRGSNTAHVALLGLMAPFDRPLGIQPSIYEYGGQYNDSLAYTIINSYAIRVEGKATGGELATVDYEQTATRYLGHIGAVFPADLVTRPVAAVRAVPRFFLEYLLYPPTWVRSRFGIWVYRLRARISWRLAPLALAAVAVATLFVTMGNPRAGWLIVLIMATFAGASAIQFNERHFYYLELIPWWAFGFLAQTVTGGAGISRQVTNVYVRRAVVLSVAVSACVGAAVLLSRRQQERSAARLFDGYEAAPRSPLVLMPQDAGAGRTLLATEEWLNPLPSRVPRVVTRFLAVAFRDELCGSGTLPLTTRYQAALADLDFSETIVVDFREGAGPTTLFLAAYDRAEPSVRFRGLEVPTDRVRCVRGVSRVEGLDRVPLLLTMTLKADWRDEPLYQRLR